MPVQTTTTRTEVKAEEDIIGDPVGRPGGFNDTKGDVKMEESSAEGMSPFSKAVPPPSPTPITTPSMSAALNKSESRSTSVSTPVRELSTPASTSRSTPHASTSTSSSNGVQFIHHLPVSLNEAMETFSPLEKNWYQFKTLGLSRMLGESGNCECWYEPSVPASDEEGGEDDLVGDLGGEDGEGDFLNGVGLGQRRRRERRRKSTWSPRKSRSGKNGGSQHGPGRHEACGPDSECINRLTQVECLDGECRCGEACQNQRFQKGSYANIAVVKTEMKGFGLRAEADLTKDTFIYEYIGDVVSNSSFKRRMREYAEEGIEHFYFMMLQKDEFIDATKFGCIARFANHSCRPNCYVAKWTVGKHVRMGIFAKRDIVAGEEITFNYNVDRYGHQAQICYCGESNCVGFIGGKTQTETDLSAMDDLTLDALGLSEDSELMDYKGSKKKGTKSKKIDDPDFMPNVKPLTLKDVPKVVQAIRQTQSKKILARILTRIRITEDVSALRQIMRLRGYSLMKNILEDFDDDKHDDIRILVLECMSSWPLLSRNKVEDSQVHIPVKKLVDEGSEGATRSETIVEAPETETPTEMEGIEEVDDSTQDPGTSEPVKSEHATKQEESVEMETILEQEVPSGENDVVKDEEPMKMEGIEEGTTSAPPEATPAPEPMGQTISRRELIKRTARNLLQIWDGLTMGYRIPKKAKDDTQADESRRSSPPPAAPVVFCEDWAPTTQNKRKYESDNWNGYKPGGKPIPYQKSNNQKSKGPPRSFYYEPPPEKKVEYIREPTPPSGPTVDDIIKASIAKKEREDLEAKEKEAAERARMAEEARLKEEKKERKRQKQMRSEEEKEKEKEAMEANKEKKLQKLVGAIVIEIMKPHMKVVGKEGFKTHAKEVTEKISQSEKKKDWYKDDRLDSLSEEKQAKIRKFATDYITRIIHKIKKEKRTSRKSEPSTPSSSHRHHRHSLASAAGSSTPLETDTPSILTPTTSVTMVDHSPLEPDEEGRMINMGDGDSPMSDAEADNGHSTFSKPLLPPPSKVSIKIDRDRWLKLENPASDELNGSMDPRKRPKFGTDRGE